MSSDSLAFFFKDFANMLTSGIGLESALRTLSETSCEGRLRAMSTQTLGELEIGTTLVNALAVSNVLPREALMAIEAGEKAGELPIVFMMLGEYFEVQSEMRKRMLSAIAYPSVVIGLLIGVLLYVALYVIPKVALFLPAQQLGSPATWFLLKSATVLKDHAGLIGACILLSCVGIGYLLNYRSNFMNSLLAKMPILGQVMKEKELSLGFFTIYLLQKSGVPLDVSLREAAKVAGGETERHIETCVSYLIGGVAFSEAVRQDIFFPRFTADTLRVGEESGRFTEYFERLYKIFYRSFRSKVEVMSETVRPVLLMFSAGLIMLIAFGFLQPLYGNLATISAP